VWDKEQVPSRACRACRKYHPLASDRDRVAAAGFRPSVPVVGSAADSDQKQNEGEIIVEYNSANQDESERQKEAFASLLKGERCCEMPEILCIGTRWGTATPRPLPVKNRHQQKQRRGNAFLIGAPRSFRPSDGCKPLRLQNVPSLPAFFAPSSCGCTRRPIFIKPHHQRLLWLGASSFFSGPCEISTISGWIRRQEAQRSVPRSTSDCLSGQLGHSTVRRTVWTFIVPQCADTDRHRTSFIVSWLCPSLATFNI
jgi:hypothetical protein